MLLFLSKQLLVIRRAWVQATVAYYLIADKKRRMPSSAYLRAELTEAHDAQHQYPSGGLLPGSLMLSELLACLQCFCAVSLRALFANNASRSS